jgi:hypothetical protein
MPRVYWFCTSAYPDLPYTGLIGRDDGTGHLLSLHLVRAGQIYKAVSLPENLTSSCYGERKSSRWGIPAIYWKQKHGWVCLTSGCAEGAAAEFKSFVKLYSKLPDTARFFLTYEPDASGRTRLHIRVRGESWPIRWKRISRTELELNLCFNTP